MASGKTKKPAPVPVRTAHSGDVSVSIDEGRDLAILMMPVREAVMLMALAGQTSGPPHMRPGDTFDAMTDVFGWGEVRREQINTWHHDLYRRFGFGMPAENEYGCIMFGSPKGRK